MRVILAFLILNLTLAAFGQEFKFDYKKDFYEILEQTSDKTSNLYYLKLLPRFQSNDTTLTDYEVLALMIRYTEDSNYHAYSDISVEREIYSLNGENKCIYKRKHQY